MYVCLDCHGTFEEPISYKEKMGEFWGFPAYETFYICPCCGSSDYDEYKRDSVLDEDLNDMSVDDLMELKEEVIETQKEYDDEDIRYMEYSDLISDIDFIISKKAA